MVELLPNPVIGAAEIALVRLDDVEHHLRILFLLVFGDATVG
jgi:hypothetical protein